MTCTCYHWGQTCFHQCKHQCSLTLFLLIRRIRQVSVPTVSTDINITPQSKAPATPGASRALSRETTAPDAAPKTRVQHLESAPEASPRHMCSGPEHGNVTCNPESPSRGFLGHRSASAGGKEHLWGFYGVTKANLLQPRVISEHASSGSCAKNCGAVT